MKTRTISFSLPTFDEDLTQITSSIKERSHAFSQSTLNLFSLIKSRGIGLLHSFIGLIKERRGFRKSSSGLKTQFGPNLQPLYNFYKKIFKNRKLLLLVIGILVLLFGGAKLLGGNSSKSSGNDSKIDIQEARATRDVNKEFSFPLKNEKGEQIAELKYLIEKAELRDEIIVDGKRATAVKGRTFLILILKITNDYKSSVKINAKDYVRLSVNGNKDEWLAPDIHNDPVDVQAISTKNSRLGFPINETDTNLVLSVGEINGDKEEIQLDIN